jgi:hypothetical protein
MAIPQHAYSLSGAGEVALSEPEEANQPDEHTALPLPIMPYSNNGNLPESSPTSSIRSLVTEEECCVPPKTDSPALDTQPTQTSVKDAAVQTVGASIALADVSQAANFDVRTSSFFQSHERLPSPGEVRSRPRAQRSAGTHWGWKERCVYDDCNRRPTPAVFEDMSLFVKGSIDVYISEAQALYAIRNSCGDSAPVPEIYGWRTDGKETIFYMQAIYRKTLQDA